MKLIFLDIDGVLAVRYRRQDEFGSGFHPEYVANLARLVQETGAYLVVSSTWRMSGLTRLYRMWRARHLPGLLFGTTGHAGSADIVYLDVEDGEKRRRFDKLSTLPRGLEIEHYLKEIGLFQRINWCPEKQQEYVDKAVVKNYVILDDDSDMLLNQAEHFVKCSQRRHEADSTEGYGLTSKATDEAIRILNTPVTELYYKS